MNKNIALAYLAQFINLGASFILLPFTVRILEPEYLAVWYIFSALAGFSMLMEFGFQSTISRNVTYVYAGAKNIPKNGIPEMSQVFEFGNRKLLSDVINASKIIYRRIVILASTILIIPGTFYILYITRNLLDSNVVILSWILFATGQMGSLYFNYINSSLLGKFRIAEVNIAQIFTRLTYILITIVLLEMNFSLLSLGIASFLSLIIGRMIIKFYFTRYIAVDLVEVSKNGDVEKIIKSMWFNASKVGYVEFGTFMILKANIFIVSIFTPLSEVAKYGLTLSLINMLSSLTTILVNINMPYLNSLQRANSEEKNLIKNRLALILFVTYFLYFIGLFLLVYIGPQFLGQIKSKVMLLNFWQMMLMGLFCFLEINHSIFAAYLTTKNNIPFVSSALISGAAIVILDIIFTPIYGLWAIIIVQGFVQLAYNNWYWPCVVLKELDTKTWKLLLLGYHEFKFILFGKNKA